MSNTPVLLAEIAECIVSRTTSYTLNNTKITKIKTKLTTWKIKGANQIYNEKLPSCGTKITRILHNVISRMTLLRIRLDLLLTTSQQPLALESNLPYYIHIFLKTFKLKKQKYPLFLTEAPIKKTLES